MNTLDLLRTPTRKLDGPPPKISVKKAKEIRPFGCQSEFIIAYDECKRMANNDAVPVLETPIGNRIMDIEVYNVMITLIKSSVCRNKDRARACFNIFLNIAQINCDTLTKNRLFDHLAQYSSMGMWEDEIVKGIIRCVYARSEVVSEWLELAEYFNPYPATMSKCMDLIEQNCHDIKELKLYIKKISEQMRQDKDFKGTRKANMNKFMAPVVWTALQLEG